MAALPETRAASGGGRGVAACQFPPPTEAAGASSPPVPVSDEKGAVGGLGFKSLLPVANANPLQDASEGLVSERSFDVFPVSRLAPRPSSQQALNAHDAT